MSRLAILLLGVPLLLQLSGCERMMHNMYDQPRGKAYRADPLIPDGSARIPPEGTVPFARGARPGSSSGRLGAQDAMLQARDQHAQTQPYPLEQQLLLRGQQRYNIYCLPCHSPIGDGDGRVARRGFPSPPSYHSDRLRGVPDRYIYDVISKGYGVMASYADRIAPADRWAIVAYVRALQLSQRAMVDRLPPALAEKARKELAVTDSGGAPVHNTRVDGGKP